jgi:uncharacterized Ntn-hydrolase superfamily protein
MTFSIVARCARTGQLGVGALTAMAGVGKIVAHVRPHAGAAATQATPNPYLAYDGLPLLAEGRPPQQVLDQLLEQDPDRDLRQVGMVDREGRAVAWTGPRTPEWPGHRTGPAYAVQGNRLVGPETVDEVVRVFTTTPHLDLAERLLLCLEGGEATGADREGAQSATISVVAGEDYPLWDLRVDDAEDPAAELRRLFGVFKEQVLPNIRKLPTRDDPLGQAAREQLAEQ